MNSYETVNDVLVKLFNEIMDVEERALITSEYKDISVNDMHVIEAIGIREPKNMSTVARAVSVTVGTLTIAINHLVKKGYVERSRSEEDRRVVLVSLSEKGEKAYFHHRMFHEKMVMEILDGMDEKETEVREQTYQTEDMPALLSFYCIYFSRTGNCTGPIVRTLR